MRLLCFGALLLTTGARADRFDDATLDVEAAAALAKQLATSVVLLDVVLAVPEWADKSLAPRGNALAVCVVGPDGLKHLVTSGPLVTDSASVSLHARAESEASTPIRGWRPLGDGALAELLLDGDCGVAAGLPREAPPAAPDSLDPREGPELDSPIAFVPKPVFAVAAEMEPPTLSTGATVERLRPPLDHLIAVTPATLPGTAWFDVTGHVMALAYRTSPQDDDLALAVRGETLREWLRPEGPPYDSDPPAAGAP